MAVADDLDRATDSKWDWVAEHTRTYLASGGTEGHGAQMARIFPLYDEYAQKTDRVIPIVLLTPQN